MPFTGNGAWMYQFDSVVQQGFAAWQPSLNHYQVRTLFMSLPPGWNGLSAQTAAFIQNAHAAGIQVHAMTLEDPSFAHTDGHDTAIPYINDILTYCQNNPGSGFDGIHLDTEPQQNFVGGDEPTAAQWQQNDQLMQEYGVLLQKTREQINAVGQFQFSAAIAWWFHARALLGNLPSGSSAVLGQYVDFLVPMVYPDGTTLWSPQNIIDRVQSQVPVAPTVVGIKAATFGNDPALLAAVNTINGYFQRPGDQYLGIALYALPNLYVNQH